MWPLGQSLEPGGISLKDLRMGSVDPIHTAPSRLFGVAIFLDPVLLHPQTRVDCNPV